jgi:hypothetical protein
MIMRNLLRMTPNGLELSDPARTPSEDRAELAGSACPTNVVSGASLACLSLWASRAACLHLPAQAASRGGAGTGGQAARG